MPDLEYPREWNNPELLSREITFTSSVYRLLILHGALVVASRHPGLAELKVASGTIEEFLSHIEQGLEQVGMVAPAGGWRATLPMPDSGH